MRAGELEPLLPVAHDEEGHARDPAREPLRLLVELAELGDGRVEHFARLRRVEPRVARRREQNVAVARRLLLAKVRAEHRLHERVLLIEALLLRVRRQTVAVQGRAGVPAHGEALDAGIPHGAPEAFQHRGQRVRPELADVVIADPPRSGLRAEGVEQIRKTEAPHVLLVSCDAGALGRDASLMITAGYELDQVDVVDMFPQTSHVEVVSGWIRNS